MWNETGTSSSSPPFRSVWLAVFFTELAVLSIVNGFTILTQAVARNRHLRKRTTYLIINLTMADLFVGKVSGPLYVYHMIFKPGSGFIVMFLENVFTTCSLLSVALLSLERLHATLFPIQTLFNVGLGLLQGRCLHLDLSCHPSIPRRRVFPDCTKTQSIRYFGLRS